MDADADRTYRPHPQPRSRPRSVEIEYNTDNEGADPGRRVWPAAVGVAIVGVVMGLLVGLLYSATQSTTYQASTSVSVLPDPNLNFSDTNTNNAPDQDATAFIQSQLVVVNGAQLAERVRTELNLDSTPQIEATQLGQTYVVSIVATADNRSDAVRVASRVATDYDRIRTGQLTDDINSRLRDTNSQITTVSKSLTSSRRGSSNSSQLSPSQTALQTEYERLLSQRSALNGVKAQSERIVSVVAPARSTSPGLSATAKDMLVGGLIGLIVALAAFVVLRRSVRRVRTVADLAALGLPALLPVQSQRPWQSRRGSGRLRPDANARLLAARLDPDLTTGEPIAFVGVSATAGADRVSLSVAAALTDRGRVLYLPRPTTPGTTLPWFALPSTVSSWDELDADGFEALLERSDVPGVWQPARDAATTVSPRATRSSRGSHPTRMSRTAHLASLFSLARRHGFVLVVETDPVSDSDMAIDCGRAGASLVLVVARDATSPADVVVANELFAAQTVTLLGAVLTEAPPLPLRPLLARRQRAARRVDSPGRGASGRTAITAGKSDADATDAAESTGPADSTFVVDAAGTTEATESAWSEESIWSTGSTDAEGDTDDADGTANDADDTTDADTTEGARAADDVASHRR